MFVIFISFNRSIPNFSNLLPAFTWGREWDRKGQNNKGRRGRAVCQLLTAIFQALVKACVEHSCLSISLTDTPHMEGETKLGHLVVNVMCVF